MSGGDVSTISDIDIRTWNKISPYYNIGGDWLTSYIQANTEDAVAQTINDINQLLFANTEQTIQSKWQDRVISYCGDNFRNKYCSCWLGNNRVLGESPCYILSAGYKEAMNNYHSLLESPYVEPGAKVTIRAFISAAFNARSKYCTNPRQITSADVWKDCIEVQPIEACQQIGYFHQVLLELLSLGGFGSLFVSYSQVAISDLNCLTNYETSRPCKALTIPEATSNGVFAHFDNQPHCTGDVNVCITNISDITQIGDGTSINIDQGCFNDTNPAADCVINWVNEDGCFLDDFTCYTTGVPSKNGYKYHHADPQNPFITRSNKKICKVHDSKLATDVVFNINETYAYDTCTLEDCPGPTQCYTLGDTFCGPVIHGETCGPGILHQETIIPPEAVGCTAPDDVIYYDDSGNTVSCDQKPCPDPDPEPEDYTIYMVIGLVVLFILLLIGLCVFFI